MTDSNETQGDSIAELEAEAFQAYVSIEERVEQTQLEDLVDSVKAAKLGLAWAEAYFRYAELMHGVRLMRSSDSPGLQPARHMSLENREERLAAILDARQGYLEPLKHMLVECGIFNDRSAMASGIRLVVIGLSIPNEIDPKLLKDNPTTSTA